MSNETTTTTCTACATDCRCSLPACEFTEDAGGGRKGCWNCGASKPLIAKPDEEYREAARTLAKGMGERFDAWDMDDDARVYPVPEEGGAWVAVLVWAQLGEAK